MTIYEQFIEHLKNEEKQRDLNDKNLEKHHILPLHDGGLKNGPTVLCSSQEHTLAHYYRYLAYRQRGDLVAFTMRWNQKKGVNERVQLAVEKNKQLQNTFWNSNWQSMQGQKGGKKSGRKNALLHRQGFILSETLKRCTYWQFSNVFSFHCNKKNMHYQIIYQNKTTVRIKVKPQSTFLKLVQILNQTQYCHKEINANNFSKLLRGERRGYYNCQLIGIALDKENVRLSKAE